jgi:hypothetical protein
LILFDLLSFCGTRCSEKCEDAEKIRKLVNESFELAAKLCFGDVLGPFKELTFWIYGKQAMDVSRRYDELLEKVLKEHEDKRSSSHRHGDENERDIMDILLDVYHDAHAEFKITRTHIKAFFLVTFIYHILLIMIVTYPFVISHLVFYWVSFLFRQA